jgi:beta-lactamase class A
MPQGPCGWVAAVVIALLLVIAATATSSASGQTEPGQAAPATSAGPATNAAAAAAVPAAELDQFAATAARAAIEKFADDKIREQDLAVTVIDLRDPQHPRSGSFRGDARFFPASVVKLFYLVATHRWLDDGKLADTPELRRTMHDMIVDSSNDATAAIVDALTDAPNGAPLPEEQMRQWSEQRNAVNRYYASLGYRIGGSGGINVCQKTYCEGPYGRERVFLGPKYENRNQLTTNATARLLCEIVRGRAVSAERSEQMMKLLHRDIASRSEGADDQAHDFTARALEPGTRLWSKAGWTSTARHDAAYVETGDGSVKAILVTFTTGHARHREIIPTIAGRILQSLRQAQPR